MNKLMLTAALAVTALTGMSEITSANIVGYSGNQLRLGATLVSPQFLGIGTTGGVMKLEDLVPVGDVDTDGGFYIDILNYHGGTAESYQWIDWGEGDTQGWCDGDYAIVEGVSFAPGQGLWIIGDDGQYLRIPAPEL